MFNAEFVKRFEAKFVKSDGCWVWQASVAGKGYGQMKLPKQRRQEYAHRLSYLIYRSSIPLNMQVCHKCDNQRCVNPDHLFLGTCKDNLQDMKAKGRSLFGSKNARAKLDDVKVRQIRQCLETGMTQDKIAVAFGVSQMNISRIKHGKRWAHVK
jgi:DNA-binding XRE family transcriptional regulator